MATQWKVVCSSLNIRSGPGTNYEIRGSFPKGSILTEVTRSSHGSFLWIQYRSDPARYVCAYGNGHTYMKTYTAPATPTVTETAVDSAADMSANGYAGGTADYADTSVGTFTYNIRNALAIHGLPYQFMPIADPRITKESDTNHNSDKVSLGEEYAERIISRMPLLLMTPGHPEFLPNNSDTGKGTVLETLISGLSGDTEKSEALKSTYLDNVKSGRYYTFSYDTKDYFNYVNPMCRMAARYLELQNTYIDQNGKSVKITNMDWHEYTATKLTSFAQIGAMGAIGFYINSETSISESFSNSTSESQLASSINSISDYGREMKFLLGYSSAATGLTDAMDTSVNDSITNIQDTVSKLLGKGNFLSNLTTHLTTVVQGGKLIFPQIWSDSTFGRSYDVSIKLTSPDCNKASIYFNILVPIFHLLGFVEPHSLDANPNGYTTPFLTRAVYKGFFNVDMGIITSMNVTRGGEGMWTPDGIPTVADINFTITDLYNVLTITPMELGLNKFTTLNNTALMDYVANICGINIFKPEIARMVDMWLIMNSNAITDYFEVNLWGGIKDKIQNSIMSIYRF